ncbi:MAG: hypothetical protein V7K90_17310 [Nostoc sp.]|uniref:hypothetical protein n=1 Tax=Nostoc sp. TaxID=1180 RepID=UPI002FFBE667
MLVVALDCEWNDNFAASEAVMLIFSLGDRIHILAIGSITLPETEFGSISLPQVTLILEGCITHK